MPKIIKEGASHILLSLFVAPIVLTLFAWAGESQSKSTKTNILMPIMMDKLTKMDEKQDKILQTVNKNSVKISSLETYRDYTYREAP